MVELKNLGISILIGLAIGLLYLYFIGNEPYGVLTVFILSVIVSYYKRRKKKVKW